MSKVFFADGSSRMSCVCRNRFYRIVRPLKVVPHNIRPLDLSSYHLFCIIHFALSGFKTYPMPANCTTHFTGLSGPVTGFFKFRIFPYMFSTVRFQWCLWLGCVISTESLKTPFRLTQWLLSPNRIFPDFSGFFFTLAKIRLQIRTRRVPKPLETCAALYALRRISHLVPGSSVPSVPGTFSYSLVRTLAHSGPKSVLGFPLGCPGAKK